MIRLCLNTRRSKALAFLALVVFPRILFLDADIPEWDVARIQPIDEFYYTIPGFNLYNHGTLTYKLLPWLPDDGAPTLVLQNVAVAVGLSIFGNNFYGLRMPSVLASLLVIAGLVPILRDPVDSARQAPAKWLPWLAALYLAFDFSFLVNSRTADARIFSLLTVTAVLLLIGRRSDDPLDRWGSPAALGVLGVACVVLTSLECAFVPVALLAFAARGSQGGRDCLRRLGAFALGALACLLAWDVLSLALFGVRFLEWARSLVESYGGGAGVSNSIGELSAKLTTSYQLNHLRLFLSASIFRQNLALLIAFLFFVPHLVWRSLRERRAADVAVCALLGAYYLSLEIFGQGAYLHRKQVVMLPLVLYVVVSGLSGARASGSPLPWRQAWPPLAGLATAALLARWVDGFSYGLLPKLDTQTAAIVQASACAALLLLGIGRLGSDATRKLANAAFFLLLALPQLYLDARFLFVRPTFEYRDAMSSFAGIVDDKVTAGGWSMAMRLYNRSSPIVNSYSSAYYFRIPGNEERYYATLKRLFDEGIAVGTFDYVARAPVLKERAGLVLRRRFQRGDVQGLEFGYFTRPDR